MMEIDDDISMLFEDRESDSEKSKITRTPQRCTVCHKYKKFDEILGTNKSGPHYCTGKCKGLAACGIERFHPAKKKSYEKWKKLSNHKKTVSSLKQQKDKENTFAGLVENRKDAPTGGPKFHNMVTRLRGQLNDKKSSAFEELDEILNKRNTCKKIKEKQLIFLLTLRKKTKN